METLFDTNLFDLYQLVLVGLGILGAAFVTIFQEGLKGWAIRSLHFLWEKAALFLATVTKAEIGRTFRSKRHAEEQIAKDIVQSPFVLAWIGRGNYLQGQIMDHVNQTGGYKVIRVLIPDPRVSGGSRPDWTAINEVELAKIDKLYGDGRLKAQLVRAQEDLEGYKKKDLLDYRPVNFPHLGRLIITDKNAYYTPYNDRQPSAFNRTIAFRKGNGTVMYDNYLRLFNMLWENQNRDHSHKENPA